MQPLDDFYYFAKVIEHGGYAKAARALHIPKSRLSRHVSALETRLGVRLVNRSTRKFAVTPVGQEVRQHALAMLSEADAAVEAVEFARAEPRGLVRVSVPVDITQGVLADALPEFLVRFPSIRLVIESTNRRVDVVKEGFDVALRVRTTPSGEDGLITRTYGKARHLLVASPTYLNARGRPQTPNELEGHATLGFAPHTERQTWEMIDSKGESARFEHLPRLVCDDFSVLRSAALAGLGIAIMPVTAQTKVKADVDAGSLEIVLPDWSLPLGIFHAVFPTRRGLLPSVRAFLDFLGEKFVCVE